MSTESHIFQTEASSTTTASPTVVTKKESKIRVAEIEETSGPQKIMPPGSTPFIVDTLISQSNTISKGAYPVLQSALIDFYRGKSELMMPLAGLSNQARSFPIQAVSLTINAKDLHEAPGQSIEKPIAIKDIFKSTDELKDKKNIQRVLIEGSSGVGKTTLVQFIAWQWAEHGLFNDYDYLLCVPLRKWLSGTSNVPTTFAEDLAAFLHPCFFPKETTTARLVELEAVLSSQSSRTLLVLDGYDEVEHHLYSDSINGQLLRQALQFKQVIVTTRDYHLPPADVTFDKTLTNIGFTDAQIEKYICHYIKWRGSSQTLDSKDDSKSNTSSSLIQALRRNPRLWRLSHTPFNLALVCETQSRLPTQTEALGELTLTALYEQVMKWFLLQQLQKQGQIPKLYDMATLKREFIIEWDSLSTLAWEGFQKKEVLLSIATQQRLLNTLRKRYDTQENLERFLERTCNLGLLRSEDPENPNLLEQPRYFIHFTLQEYLAACYVVDTLQGYRGEVLYQETLAWIAQHKYDPHAAVMMGFIAGISIQPGYEQAFASCWHAWLSPPHDLTGLAHLRLMLRCLEEARCDPSIPHCVQLIKEIQQWGKSLLVPKLRDTEVFNGFWRLVCQYPHVWKQTHLMDVLLAAVGDQNLDIQLLALGAFQSMGGELARYPEALAAVLKAADAKSNAVREAAVKALGSMGIELAGQPEAVKVVLKATNDEHYYIREAALDALEGMSEKLSQYPEALAVVLKATHDKDVQAQSVEIQTLEDIDAELSLHPRTLQAILHVSSNANHVLQAHWTLYVQNAIHRYLSIEHNDSTFGGRILKSLKGNPRNPWLRTIVHAVSLCSIPFSASLIMDNQTLQIRLDGEKETLELIFPSALKSLIKSITSSYASYQLKWPDYAACVEGKPFYPRAKQPTFRSSVWSKPHTLPSISPSSPTVTRSESGMQITLVANSKSNRTQQLKKQLKPITSPSLHTSGNTSLPILPVETELRQQLLLSQQRQLLDAFLINVQKMVQRTAALYVPADQRRIITEPQVFLSYAWEVEGTRLKRLQETFLRDTLAKDLRRVGISPWLDIERMVGCMDGQMRGNIKDSQFVILIGTQRYAERTSITHYEHRTNVGKELEFTLEQAKKSNDFLLPLLLEGEWGTTFPEISKNYLVFDCRTWFSLEQGWVSFEQYIHGLTQPSPLGILPAILGMSRLNDYPEYRKALGEEYQTLYRNLVLELQSLTPAEFLKENKKNQSFSFASTTYNPTLFSPNAPIQTLSSLEIQPILSDELHQTKDNNSR